MLLTDRNCVTNILIKMQYINLDLIYAFIGFFEGKKATNKQTNNNYINTDSIFLGTWYLHSLVAHG